MSKLKWLCVAGTFAMAALANSAFAQTAHDADSFHDLKQALESGKPVAALLDLGLCASKNSTGSSMDSRSKIKGGLRIQSFIEPDSSTIVFSDLHTTVMKAPPYDLVYEFMRYTVGADNSVQFQTFFWSDANPTRQAPSVWQCEIGKGVRFGW